MKKDKNRQADCEQENPVCIICLVQPVSPNILFFVSFSATCAFFILFMLQYIKVLLDLQVMSDCFSWFTKKFLDIRGRARKSMWQLFQPACVLHFSKLKRFVGLGCRVDVDDVLKPTPHTCQGYVSMGRLCLNGVC